MKQSGKEGGLTRAQSMLALLLLQAYLILFHFALLYFEDIVVFYKMKICSNHLQKRL